MVEKSMLYKQKYILLFINNIFKVLLTKMGHDFMEQILRLWQALCFGIETDLEKMQVRYYHPSKTSGLKFFLNSDVYLLSG